tara:strand:- start:144 stop:1172 length:1029 start_codon:yes stop_codon:yes gene_type:complete
MSDEIGSMSQEDRFLGVKTTVEPPSDESTSAQIAEIDVEIVDDRPEADRRPAAGAASPDDGMATDEEISSYGSRAQQRIKKLKWEFHEQRRAKDKSDRLAGEAVNYTQTLQVENQRLLRLVQDSQSALNQHSKYGAEAAVAIAEANFKQAHESGESDQIAKAQKALTSAQLAEVAAPAVSGRVTESWKQNVLSEQRQEARQQQPSREQVAEDSGSPAAKEWQQNNPWFGDDEEMTSHAYGLHEKLVKREGVDPETQEYYELIDNRMRQKWPEYFSPSSAGSSGSVAVEPATRRKASPVVAPAMRNNGAAPRKVQLTSTQVALAERLGITLQQYAAQLMKERA